MSDKPSLKADKRTVQESKSQSEEIIHEIKQRSADPEWSKVALHEVSQDIDGLKQLMVSGAWRSAISLSTILINESKYPHEKMRLYICLIMGYMKLRDYNSAAAIFESIGDFQDKKYQYSTYPELYPSREGSFVPFSLKILCGEVLYVSGKDSTMSYLFSLKSYCNNKQKELQDSTNPAAISMSEESIFEELDETSLQLWQQREYRLTCLIASRLVDKHDTILALELIINLYNNHPNDSLLFLIGKLYVQVGDLNSAGKVLEKLKDKESVDYYMLQGFIRVISSTHSEAAYAFSKVLSIDKANIEALNNLAICHLYLGNISLAIITLEDAIFSNPTKVLTESLIANLWFMYDMISDKNFDKRTKVLQLVKDHADDDFRLSVLKL